MNYSTLHIVLSFSYFWNRRGTRLDGELRYHLTPKKSRVFVPITP